MICERIDHADSNDKMVTGKELAKLLRRLLNIVVMESTDIEDGNIGKLGKYSSVKKEIMCQMGKSDEAVANVEQGNDIKDLIDEIKEINEKNAKALLNLREKIKDELSVLHTSKKTHEAYISNAIADKLEEA